MWLAKLGWAGGLSLPRIDLKGETICHLAGPLFPLFEVTSVDPAGMHSVNGSALRRRMPNAESAALKISTGGREGVSEG